MARPSATGACCQAILSCFNSTVNLKRRDDQVQFASQRCPGERREALLTLAHQSRERGWWQQYGEAVPEWFQTYVGLEAAASASSTYQAEYVPGLLQTEAYATAVHPGSADERR
jgi:Domain of unknown function (DUF5753)